MRVIYIFRLAFACLLLWPTVGLADEHEGGGHHDTKNCDTTPVKHPFHDTTLLIGDYCRLVNPHIQNYYADWKLPDVFGYYMFSGLEFVTVLCANSSSSDSLLIVVNDYGNAFRIPSSYTGTFSYVIKSNNSDCPDREGDTINIHFVKSCNTTPCKYAFHDTTLYVGDSCCLTSFSSFDYAWNWEMPFDTDDITPEEAASHYEGIVISCSSAGNPTELTINLWDIIHTTVPIGYTGPFFYNVSSNVPECPDREGDTVYITFDIHCDTTPVKLPFHDTVFCEGDSLLLVATDRPHAGYSTLWNNLSTAAEVIYEGDSFYVTEPGTYTFRLYNMVNNGCPDIEGDTVNVAYVPKPQAFLPKILVPTCGGREGALILESNQPYIDFRWSDGDSTSSYRFAYRGDTIDKRFCLLTNVCGDTVLDSVSVYFQPPYAYLGGDSLVGCRGDSVLFDMGACNRHLPHYDSLRFIWTLRGDTLLDGLPGAAEDPTRLWVRFPQDSGLLTVQIFQPDSTETDNDGNPIAVNCPVATDSLKLQFYIWPDIDFFVRNGDTTICHYDSIEMFLDRDSLVFSPDAYYIWLFDSVPYDTTADKILYAADTGVYTVTGVNYCSRHSESFVLHHHPKARITVELQDTTVCPETPVSLDPTLPYGGNRYVWFKGNADGDDEGNYDDSDDGGNYMEFRNPGEAPEDGDFDTWPWEASAALWVDTPGAYTLYVMDSVGCMAHSVLNVTEEDCTPQFEAPNVFTPNGDGINDVFKLKTMEKLFDFEIRLFNRWGNQVYAYKGEPEEFSWDGTLYGNGQGAPDGVYFYVATFKDYKGKKKKQSGSVTILR